MNEMKSKKLVVSYFKKKQMCSSVEEVEQFISTLHWRNHQDRETLSLSDSGRAIVDSFFSGNALNPLLYSGLKGKVVHLLDGQDEELAVINGGTTRVEICMALADTLPEHFHKKNAAKRERKERIEEECRKRREAWLTEIYRKKEGKYNINIEMSYYDIVKNGITDISFSSTKQASCAYDAFDKTWKDLLWKYPNVDDSQQDQCQWDYVFLK